MKNVTKLLFTLLLSVASLSANATLEIVITEGIDTARPIGIVPFRWIGEGTIPGRLSNVVSADLRAGFGPQRAVCARPRYAWPIG